MRCPACGLAHSEYATSHFAVTRAGYLALAAWRAEDARNRTRVAVTAPAQAPAPSLDVAGGVRETTTGTGAAAAAGPNRGTDGAQ